ncbi:MAG TPA: AMP-binding protein [Steroidobacteraceae bacterium]|nr:AMP-binding protein [Steroidobacteraceae bacterium]
MTALHEGGTVGALLLAAIARFADRPAMADGVRHYSYAELGDAMARFITVYRALGLRKGQGLAILSSNRVESFAAHAAALLMGVRYTPLHPKAGAEDHAFIVEDAEIDTLLVEGEHFAERGRYIQERVPTLRRLLSFGPLTGIEDILPRFEAAAPAPLRDEALPAEIGWLAYTGGTTGRSKGAMLTHRAMTAMTALLAADWDWPPEIRFLACTPISHAAGAALFPVILRGGFIRLLPEFEAERFCATVAAERITATFLVPTIVYVLLDRSEIRARHDLSSLQTIVYGAAPMSPDRLQEAMQVFGRVFVQMYGQTEAPQIVTTLRKVDHDPAHPERFASCGQPSLTVTVRLFDAQMNEVADGEPGEICVRGAIVMDGYWKRPDATAEAFRGGWLHTGDVARRDQNGYLYIVDRTKDMIITGGFNVYPREVEDALMSHPSVSSAIVIGVPDEKWGEAVTAFVVLREGAQATAEELQGHVKQVRGAVWAPKAVEFRSALPLTPLGKPDRKALRAPYWAGRSRGVA